MPSSTASRPSRSGEPPSRHIVSGTPGSGIRKQQMHLRPHQPPPVRPKVKDAVATPPPSTQPDAALSSNNPHPCFNCHQADTRFYCEPCLASRIQAHRAEMRRLSDARDKANLSVKQILFENLTTKPDTTAAHSLTQTPHSSTKESALPDPFDTNAAEPSSSDLTHHHLLLHSLIQARARRAAILSRVQSIHRCISELQQLNLHSQGTLKERKANINLRKQNLAKAWSGLEGSSAPSSPSALQRSRLAAKSRWLAHPAADHIDVPLVYTDVYIHYERHTHDPDQATVTASGPDDQQLGASLTRARSQLASLQSQATAVSAELSATRAALARKAFALFSVTPPDNASTKLASIPSRQRQVDLSASSSVAQKISRLSEKYIPGAFGLGNAQSPPSPPHTRGSNSATRQSRAATHSSSSRSSSSWSIVNLPLPLPSETRRYPRDTVNGAVTYTANLLQLLAGYLGVALPFAIEQHKGRLAIRPDPLWDGGGGSSAKTLYLSSSGYNHLTASQPASARTSKLNNLAESTIGLGASTLSTIESYIHLPSGGGLPWGLASGAAPSVKPGANATDADQDAPRSRTPSDDSGTAASSAASGSPSSKSKPDQAAKSFVSALVMLSYDVAYLATKQGCSIDLVAAAANPLWIMSTIMQQPELGRIAHSSHIHSSTIQDLSLPSLDYEQLAQILEPMNAAADGYKRGATRSNNLESSSAASTRSSNNKTTKTQKILEQSYVDVQEAAASVLDIKDPSSVQHRTSQQPSSRSAPQKVIKDPKTATSKPTQRPETVSSLQKQRVGADKRNVPAAQPPPSLDFLRQRGRDASKAKSPPEGTKTLTTAPEPKEERKKGAETEAKVRPGAVIFNGVEVGIGNLNTAEASSGRRPSQKSRKQSTEEGWDLV